MLSVSLASVLCKVRGLILEGAELAGLAELESDLKKYGFLGDSAPFSELEKILQCSDTYIRKS